MTFMANNRVKIGVHQGQILKSKESYRVVHVPQMKALGEHFLDLLKFDAMTSFDDAMT
jgi:hypothetical protein